MVSAAEALMITQNPPPSVVSQTLLYINLINMNASPGSYTKTMAIAECAFGCSRQKVRLFLLGLLQGGDDAVRSGRPPSFGSLELVTLIAEQH